MRVPIRHINGHLLWSVQGTVWALWRITPEGGRYQNAQVREETLAKVTALVRSLAGAPRFFGLCAQTDPGEVAFQMIDGVPMSPGPGGEQHPWAEATEAALDLLDGQEMHTRTLWLAVPLASSSRQEAGAAVASMWAHLSAELGLQAAPVPRSEVTACHRQAARIAAAIGSALELRPATPAEIVWIVQHALYRGLAEPLLAEAATSGLYGGRLRGGVLRSPSYADLGQVRLTEGGHSAAGSDDGGDGEHNSDDDADFASARRGWGALLRPRHQPGSGGSPLARRWLEVETEHGTGYQAHLVLAQLPPAVSGDCADLFVQLESLPFPVDFTVDMEVLTSAQARKKIQAKKKDLVEQADQYGAQVTGMPASVPEAVGDLGEMDARLSRSSVEVEVQPVTVLTVWGPTAAVCDARARALGAVLAQGDYRAVRPTGRQEQLFALGLPGTTRPAVLREFVQVQLSEDWALMGAATGGEAGDPTGILIGFDQDCGTTRPVLIDPADAPAQNASASLGVVGDLGSGKSVLLKLLKSSIVDRGGRAIVIDRTPVREWAAYAQGAAPGRHQIVDAASAQVSIDPLRIFGGATGAHYALSYLTLQLGIGAMSTSGSVLHRAVEEAAAAPRPSMAGVLTALDQMAAADAGAATRRDAAVTLADLLRIVARNPLAAMVFDEDLPPLTLDHTLGSDLVVVTTAGLTLPPKEAFAQPEVLRQQPLEALIGRAVLYLIAAIARQAAFSDTSQFCGVWVDECYWLTSSAEGTALVHEILHDGRKHLAGLFMGGHDAEELGPDRGLLAYRVLARTTNRERAARGIEFLGLDPKDESLLRTVTTDLSPVGQKGREGEMLLCAPRQNTCRLKVAIPDVARIRQRISTTPTTRPSAGSPTARPSFTKTPVGVGA
ncbi:ATP-binding protein [Streptomyces sp. NPDC087440]|uniref:ATP-binding protein n=1 Tax=Streptomyces sp. NPDC087440 TaxID=3365790 RepID=UPI00380C3C3D